MKKSIFVFSLSVACLKANIALCPSSPLYPEEGIVFAKESFATFKTGYFIDYTWKACLQNNTETESMQLSAFTQYGALALCLSDLVDLWGFVGVQKNSLKFNENNSEIKFKESAGFSWALYADGILNQWGKLQLGAGAYYASTPYQQGQLYENSSSIQTQYQYYAWGISLGFAYDYPPMAPYARIDFQKAKSRLQGQQIYSLKYPVGLAFGFISDFTHGFFADFEIKVIQVTATRLMLGLRF